MSHGAPCCHCVQIKVKLAPSKFCLHGENGARWVEHSAPSLGQPSTSRESACRSLLQAAQSGNTADAERTLQAMAAAGLPPGPRAWHALVFAYARAGDAEGSLKAIQNESQAGGHLHIQSLGCHSPMNRCNIHTWISITCRLSSRASVMICGSSLEHYWCLQNVTWYWC